MSSNSFTNDMLKSAPKRADRRRFLGQAGIAGLSVLGATHLASITANAQTPPTDAQIFNFALNLEYLEAEFYLRAVNGTGLGNADITGVGTGGSAATPGAVTGGSQVPFVTEAVRQYAREIASDEEAHVRFLRQTLGSAAVARPAIEFTAAFNAAATAAGLPTPFNPFADENSFLLGAFLFEDVGVTAYKGASPLITNRVFLEAAAGILAVEAYHAAQIRTVLFARGLSGPAGQISDARDTLDNTGGATGAPPDLDQGIVASGQANIVPADANGLAFSRTPRQVLNIVYLSGTGTATSGGFFPAGVNGTI